MAAGWLGHYLNNFFTVGQKHTKVVWNVFYTDQASAWNRYEMDISHPRLALGPQSCTPVWQSLKSAFFAWGRLGRMRFSPTCTRPIWMQPKWEERAETRLQLSKSFVATDSLEMSLCTSYAWKVGVRESTKIAKFFHPLAWKSRRNFLSVAPTEIFKRSILFYSSRPCPRCHPFFDISNNNEDSSWQIGRDA